MNNTEQFLDAQSFLYERVQHGIDVHPSDAELDRFVDIAAHIEPELTFSPKGCQECVNSLIKFVYDNRNSERIVNFETFPKHDDKAKNDTAEPKAAGKAKA